MIFNIQDPSILLEPVLSVEPMPRKTCDLNFVGGFCCFDCGLIVLSSGLICEWDQGGLPKSVFLQAGTQPSQGHPEPPNRLEADTELHILPKRAPK